MTRRIRRSLTIILSTLVLGLSLLWIRGFLVQDKLHFALFGRLCIVASHPHHLHVLIDDRAPPPVPPYWWNSQGVIRARLDYLQPGIRLGARSDIWIPHWLPMLLIGSPLIWARIQHRIRRNQRPGLCPHCGYDLRATPDRCPECGREVEHPIQIEQR